MKHNYGVLITVALTIRPFVESLKKKNNFDVTPIEDTIVETTPYVEPEVTDEEIIEILLNLICKRLSYAIDEARYKWKHGIEISDTKERFDQILQNAENQSKLFDIDAKQGVEFMMDQIEAGSIIQYSLISNWYAKANVLPVIYELAKLADIPSEGNDTVDISEVHLKMDEFQNYILFNLSSLNELRMRRDCSSMVGNIIYKIKESAHPLMRISMQASMVNFCKITLVHQSLDEERRRTIKPIIRRKYWRNPIVYTPATKKSSTIYINKYVILNGTVHEMKPDKFNAISHEHKPDTSNVTSDKNKSDKLSSSPDESKSESSFYYK